MHPTKRMRLQIRGLFFLLFMSTAFQSRAENLENIEYGQVDGISLRLDAHVPEGPGPHPAVIIVHGGGWVRGDRRTDVQPLFQPLERAGFAWFSISYRLVNNSSSVASMLFLGQAVDDVKKAIAHVKTNAAEYKIDPDRIALMGESAGAQLASLAALKPEPSGSVRAVVAFYSPSDLEGLARTSKQIPDSIRQAVQGSPLAEMLLAGLRALSPVNYVRKGMPPFLLIHGTSDSLVPFSQSEQMCDRIHEVGAACELYPVWGGGHGMRWWESSQLTDYKKRMIDWLQRELIQYPNAAQQSRPLAVQS